MKGPQHSSFYVLIEIIRTSRINRKLYRIEKPVRLLTNLTTIYGVFEADPIYITNNPYPRSPLLADDVSRGLGTFTIVSRGIREG